MSACVTWCASVLEVGVRKGLEGDKQICMHAAVGARANKPQGVMHVPARESTTATTLASHGREQTNESVGVKKKKDASQLPMVTRKARDALIFKNFQRLPINRLQVLHVF